MSIFNGKHFYNQTLKKCVAVFGTIFNNIKIVQQGVGEVRVPISYGPRKKFLARVSSDAVGAQNKSIAIKLPRMSFEITSIDFDSTSKLNKFNKRVLPVSGEAAKVNTVMQSVPYNVAMQLNILAKNQDDALQIFEQILPSFTPEYTIAVKDLEGPGTVTDVPIVLTGTSFQDDYEGDFQTRRTLIYTLDFNMKVKFAGGVSEGKIIRTVDTFFYSDTQNPTAKINNAPVNSTTLTIDNVNGIIRAGMQVFGEGIVGTPTVTSTNSIDKPTSMVISTAQNTDSANPTLLNNTILTFRFVNGEGDENVRHTVASSDEPPLDETDTITTTFGFDHG